MGRPKGNIDITPKILAEATRLFAAHGFDGTSLDDVAERVGIRKQSLLYHYPSKEILRAKVLENLLTRWNETLPQLLIAAGSPHGRLEAVVRTVVDFFHTDSDRAKLLLRELLDRPEAMRALLVEHSGMWVKMISDTLRAGQEEGSVRKDVDPEAFIVQTTHLMIGGVAAHNVLGTLLKGKGKRDDGFERYYKELLRASSASLFNEGRG